MKAIYMLIFTLVIAASAQAIDKLRLYDRITGKSGVLLTQEGEKVQVLLYEFPQDRVAFEQPLETTVWRKRSEVVFGLELTEELNGAKAGKLVQLLVSQSSMPSKPQARWEMFKIYRVYEDGAFYTGRGNVGFVVIPADRHMVIMPVDEKSGFHNGDTVRLKPTIKRSRGRYIIVQIFEDGSAALVTKFFTGRMRANSGQYEIVENLSDLVLK